MKMNMKMFTIIIIIILKVVLSKKKKNNFSFILFNIIKIIY